MKVQIWNYRWVFTFTKIITLCYVMLHDLLEWSMLQWTEQYSQHLVTETFPVPLHAVQFITPIWLKQLLHVPLMLHVHSIAKFLTFPTPSQSKHSDKVVEIIWHGSQQFADWQIGADDPPPIYVCFSNCTIPGQWYASQ